MVVINNFQLRLKVILDASSFQPQKCLHLYKSSMLNWLLSTTSKSASENDFSLPDGHPSKY